ncbi:MAG: putative quinol monooxygenase [Novosphingobium sp.]|nr:putative quinol monooxygenase [Novosphingobium sp.]
MLLVADHFRLPPEQLENVRPLMRRVVDETRREAGCLAYSYAEDVNEPGLIRVSEAWESAEALEAHFATPHMKQWIEERARFAFSGRDITRYDVTGATRL